MHGNVKNVRMIQLDEDEKFESFSAVNAAVSYVVVCLRELNELMRAQER